MWGLAVTPDGSTLVSGSGDTTVGLWDLKRRRRTTFLEGHRDKVSKVAVTKDGRWAISGALDNTARVWNLMKEEFAASLTGHDDSVQSVAISTDGRLAITGSDDGKIAVWNLELDAGPIISSSAVTRYTNAKVLLVGESGAGKTGLSKRLALNDWQPSDSTVGAWATQWKLPVPSGEGVEREIWLWDFGGQADQRLIHQLYMDETALAVLVFDGQKEDLFETLGQWDRDLTRASRKDSPNCWSPGALMPAACASAGARSRNLQRNASSAAFWKPARRQTWAARNSSRPSSTASTGTSIPCRTTRAALQAAQRRDHPPQGRGPGADALQRAARDAATAAIRANSSAFTDEELRAVLRLLAGPGVVWELKFGSWVSAPAGAHQRLRSGRDPDVAGG